jgi:hypothetical protein
MSAEKQTELFPEIAKIKELRTKASHSFQRCTNGLDTFSMYAKFLKAFGDYARTLNAKREPDCVATNLKVVKAKLTGLMEAVNSYEKDLQEAGDMLEEIARLEDYLSIPAKKQYEQVTKDDDLAEAI